MADKGSGVFDAADMNRVNQALRTLDANADEHGVTFRGDLLIETTAGDRMVLPVGYADGSDDMGHFVVLASGQDKVIARG